MRGFIGQSCAFVFGIVVCNAGAQAATFSRDVIIDLAGIALPSTPSFGSAFELFSTPVNPFVSGDTLITNFSFANGEALKVIDDGVDVGGSTEQFRVSYAFITTPGNYVFDQSFEFIGVSGNLSQSLFTSSGAAGGSFGVSATGGGQNPPLTTSSFSFTGVAAAVTLTSANVSSVIERARLSGFSANFERLLAPPPDTNVGVGETLTINSGESLTNDATFNNLGNVFNNGSLINNGILDNSGVFSNAGVVTNFHDINNQIGNLFSNGEFGTLINDNGGTITNGGALINAGALDNSNGATLVNNNALTTIIGTLTNDGDVLNNGQLRVGDVFGTISQSGTVVNNTSLVNSGTLFVEKGTLTNNDTLINDGGAVRVFQDGVIDGTGTLTQESDGFLQIDGTVEQSVVLNSGVCRVLATSSETYSSAKERQLLRASHREPCSSMEN